MLWQLSPSVIAEAGAALGILIAAVYFPWHDLNRRAGRIGSVLLIIAALWILTHSLEIGIPVASYKAYLMGLQLIWGLLALTLWLVYIIQYIAPRKWQTGRIYTLFGIIPLLAILALTTNHIYGLLWTAPGLDIHNPYLPLDPAYGPVYWVCMAYMGALVACGSFPVLKKVVQQRDYRRVEPWTLILAVVFPLLAAFIEVTGVAKPVGLTIGITPFFSGIGVIALVWALPRFQLQKIIPVARNTVFERISDGVVVLNMQNRILDLNPAAERLAGYKSSEAVGLPVEQVWPTWPRQSGLLESASTVFEELVLTHAGEQRAYDLHIYTTTDYKNHPLNKVALLVDTTGRKQAENRLKESEQRYRTLFESAVEGILIADVETKKFKHANPAICKMLGYSQEELTKLCVNDIHPITSLEHVIAEFNAQARGEKILSPGLPCLKKDGTVFYADINTSKAFIDGRECNIGFFTDITGRKQAETENQQLRDKAEISSRLAAVGEMAAGIAHEINNPLTGVIGFSELLMDEELPPKIKEQLEIIADGSHRVKDIVKRLLTFARQARPMRTSTNINELIDATLELRSYVLRTANIEVIKHLDPYLPRVMVDPGQMQQVFLNLIVNAEYAMKKIQGKGILTITTEKMDGYLHISFKDDGTGMSQETKAKLFHPFFTTKEVNEGTGLGLSLSRSIILEHGGTIEVESEPGKGAHFIITLPITQIAGEASAEITTAAPPAGKVKAAHILVVDDEEDIRKLVSTLLAQGGHTVDVTGEAGEALLKLESAVYDVILIDIRMPGMSGMELYARVLEKHPQLAGRFIFITGDTSDQTTKVFLEQNKLSYVSKPFGRTTLIQKVNELL